MKRANEFWGDQGVAITSVPEGESARRQQLTLERLEAIASFIATPQWERGRNGVPKDLAELASSIRSTHGNLKKWANDPRMTRRVTDKLWQAACYALSDILYGQIIAASPVVTMNQDGSVIVKAGDTKAANYVATVAKVIRSGLSVQQTQTFLEPATSETEVTDQELRELNEAVHAVEARVKSLEPGAKAGE